MILRDTVPDAVLDRHASLSADRLEPDLHGRHLTRRKARLPPGEGEAPARLPDRDAADLEHPAVRQRLGEASAKAGLERQPAGRARRELEQIVRPPPAPD